MGGLRFSTLFLFVTSCLIIGITSHGSTHHHHGSRERPKSFHDPSVTQDVEHIQEHYEGLAEFDASKMSPAEAEFHYFKLHDFDNNTRLDGLELLTALTDVLPYSEDESGDTRNAYRSANSQTAESRLKYYTDIVDEVLKEADRDKDGYITYTEYVLLKKPDHAKERSHNRR